MSALALHDPRDACRDRALDARNPGQPLGHELVHVLVGAEDSRRDDVVATRADAEEKDFGKLGETPGGSIHVGEARLDLDHGVVLVADLERIRPSAELDDLAPDQPLNAVPDGGLRHLKAAGQVSVGQTTVNLQLTDQLRIEFVEVWSHRLSSTRCFQVGESLQRVNQHERSGIFERRHMFGGLAPGQQHRARAGQLPARHRHQVSQGLACSPSSCACGLDARPDSHPGFPASDYRVAVGETGNKPFVLTS
jgi:hypothetical protein